MKWTCKCKYAYVCTSYAVHIQGKLGTICPSFFDESSTILSTPFHIYKANYDHRGGANGKEKGEPCPVILRLINDGLNHIGPDYGGL